jgi:dolichol-phosphate mannosyltransferase
LAASSTLVIIPTYNEIENIGNAIRSVQQHLPDAHLLVVDDSSPDGTGALVDALAVADARINVLHRDKKDGLGGAYLTGFAWALDRGYEFIGEFDADGSHPASSLPAMRQELVASDGNGLAIGSRWVKGGSVIDWPRSREILSRGGNAYARFMLGLGVHDATAGFRLYRASLLRVLDLETVASKGYCFQVDLTVRTVAAGWRIVEVPIAFQERVLGVSKMSGPIVAEAMAMVTMWGLARFFGRPGRWLAARAGTPVAGASTRVNASS